METMKCIVEGCNESTYGPRAKYCKYHAIEIRKKQGEKSRKKFRQKNKVTYKCFIDGCENETYRGSRGCKDHLPEARKYAKKLESEKVKASKVERYDETDYIIPTNLDWLDKINEAVRGTKQTTDSYGRLMAPRVTVQRNTMESATCNIK